MLRFCVSVPAKNADVAQLVEQLIRNQQVSGSNPLVGSNLINDLGVIVGGPTSL